MTTKHEGMPWKAALPRRHNWFEKIRVPSRQPPVQREDDPSHKDDHKPKDQ